MKSKTRYYFISYEVIKADGMVFNTQTFIRINLKDENIFKEGLSKLLMDLWKKDNGEGTKTVIIKNLTKLTKKEFYLFVPSLEEAVVTDLVELEKKSDKFTT